MTGIACRFVRAACFLLVSILATYNRLYGQCPCSLFSADLNFDEPSLLVPEVPKLSAPPGTFLLIKVQNLPSGNDNQYAVRFGTTPSIAHILGPAILTAVPPITAQATTVSFTVDKNVVATFPFFVEAFTRVAQPRLFVNNFFNRLFDNDSLLSARIGSEFESLTIPPALQPVFGAVESLFGILATTQPLISAAVARLDRDETQQLAALIEASPAIPVIEGCPALLGDDGTKRAISKTASCVTITGGLAALAGLIPGLQPLLVFGGAKLTAEAITKAVVDLVDP